MAFLTNLTLKPDDGALNAPRTDDIKLSLPMAPDATRIDANATEQRNDIKEHNPVNLAH